MKRLYTISLVIACLGVHQMMYAKIINGYDQEVKEAQKWIRNLNEIAKESLNREQHRRLKMCLKTAHTTAEKVQENQAKTQELIEMLRMIDPELYHEINTIKDHEGNDTDVYVKAVDDLGSGVLGITNLAHSVKNPNVYASEYGDHTVSIRINYWFPREALITLAHELGHVRYQVPHLAHYTAFYQKAYKSQSFNGNQIGHLDGDPSHQSVKETLSAFMESWSEFNRERRETAQHKSNKILASTRENDRQ